MRAVMAHHQQPVLVDLPDPSIKPDEILVEVHATALNRADLLQVAGHYPPPPGAPDTLGLEFAGNVIAVGDAVTAYQIGDAVMALVSGGGYAEKAAAPAACTMPVPDNLSLTEAAAIPEAFLTAYSNMVEIGGLQPGETVLIHAGASGVGLAAIQIAKRLDATVIVTASAPKHALCLQMGADRAIDYRNESFAEIIQREYGGVDLVIEHVGAPYWDDNVRVLNQWGRLVFIGLMGGAVKEINFSQIMRKRLTITGSTLRDREPDRKAHLVANFWRWAAPHFKSGALRPVIWQVLPLDQVAEAHQLMQHNQNAGKIVLTMK